MATGGSWATTRRTSSGYAVARANAFTAPPLVPIRSTGPASRSVITRCRSSACCSGLTGDVPFGLRPVPRGSKVTTGRSVKRAASVLKPPASIGEPNMINTGRSGVASARSPRMSYVIRSSPSPTVRVCGFGACGLVSVMLG